MRVTQNEATRETLELAANSIADVMESRAALRAAIGASGSTPLFERPNSGLKYGDKYGSGRKYGAR